LCFSQDFFELKFFEQISYFSSISRIKKCWHNYTYFQGFGAFSESEKFEMFAVCLELEALFGCGGAWRDWDKAAV